MNLRMKILRNKAKKYYENHGHFHQGDAGLDLYILEDTEIILGETKFIDLSIFEEA